MLAAVWICSMSADAIFSLWPVASSDTKPIDFKRLKLAGEDRAIALTYSC